MTSSSTPSVLLLAPLLLATVLPAWACHRRQAHVQASPGAPAEIATAAPEPVAAIMRAYDAPPGRAEELANVLHRVMRPSKELPGIGSVTAMDGDRVIVVAPPGIHEGVDALCQTLAQHPRAGGLPRIEIRYWLVEATPADITDTSAVPELADVLQEVTAAGEPASFALFEHATLASMLNSNAETSGPRTRFSQSATAHEGGIVADLEIELVSRPERLRTRIAVQPGKTVVIGQNGVDDGDTQLLYIVRAELVDAA